MKKNVDTCTPSTSNQFSQSSPQKSITSWSCLNPIVPKEIGLAVQWLKLSQKAPPNQLPREVTLKPIPPKVSVKERFRDEVSYNQ